MAQICPKCGRNDSEVEFLSSRNLCVECFSPKPDLPSRITLEICKRCGNLKHGEWKAGTNHNMIEYIRIKAKLRGWELKRVDTKSGDAILEHEIEGKKYLYHAHFDLQVDTSLCEDCSRKSGGYFEAIIQIRGPMGKVESMANRITRYLEEETFITKIEEHKNGTDIYAGSRNKAAEILSRMKIKSLRTEKLYSFKDGKNLYRTTFRIRIEEKKVEGSYD